MATPHIESHKDDIAKIVLMPGSPTRSQYIAENFLSKVKTVNTIRGMLAYTGYYKNQKVTIFPSGMGMASMGIYAYELYHEYDVEKIIRIGTCGSYIDKYKINNLILVNKAYTDSNFAYCFNHNRLKYAYANDKMNKSILSTADILDIKIGYENIFSSEIFYEPVNNYLRRVKKYHVMGVEMESFALFTIANYFHKEASCLLTVSDSFLSKAKLSAEKRDEGLNKMILLALESSLKF